MYSCVNYYHDGFNEKILGRIHVCFTAYIVAEVRNWFAKVQMIWQQPIKSYKRPHGLSHVVVLSLRVHLYFFERRAVASAEMLVSKRRHEHWDCFQTILFMSLSHAEREIWKQLRVTMPHKAWHYCS